MATVTTGLFFLVFALIKGTSSYSYCHTGWLDYKYCQYGCCGYDDYYNEYEYCCSKNVVGVIVGGIVGGLVLLTIIVTICICCYQKNRAVAGRVIQPAGYNTGGPTVVMATTNQTSGSYAYGPGTQYPPPAQQFGEGSSFSQHPPAYTSGGSYPGATGAKGSFQPQY